jgi:hypothetical protein
MTVRLNRKTARIAFEEISKDLPDLEICLPRRRDPGGTSPWQHTVRVECRKDDPSWKKTVEWARSNGYLLTEWRDINDRVVGIEITDVIIDTLHQRDHILPERP